MDLEYIFQDKFHAISSPIPGNLTNSSITALHINYLACTYIREKQSNSIDRIREADKLSVKKFSVINLVRLPSGEALGENSKDQFRDWYPLGRSPTTLENYMILTLSNTNLITTIEVTYKVVRSLDPPSQVTGKAALHLPRELRI